MALDTIALVSLRKRNILEAIATMEAQGNGGPSSFAGERIVESFGPPKILRGFLQEYARIVSLDPRGVADAYMSRLPART